MHEQQIISDAEKKKKINFFKAQYNAIAEDDYDAEVDGRWLGRAEL